MDNIYEYWTLPLWRTKFQCNWSYQRTKIQFYLLVSCNILLHLLRILPLWFWKHGFHQLLLHCLRNIWENILKNINFSSLFLFYARITYFQSPWQMIARIMDRQHKVFIFNVFNEMNLTDCSEYLFNLTDKYTSSRQQHSLKLNLFMYICGHVTSLILFTCIKSILVTTAKWRKKMVWIGLYLLSIKIAK